MSWRHVLIAPAVAYLAGCAHETDRTAHMEGDQVCVEPMPLHSNVDLVRISHAAGYLVCREHAGLPAASRPADLLELAQLVMLASADQAVGEPPGDGMAGTSVAIALVCESAEAEMLRADRWRGIWEVVAACGRRLEWYVRPGSG